MPDNEVAAAQSRAHDEGHDYTVGSPHLLHQESGRWSRTGSGLSSTP